jgi:Ca-activated chloride channel family protein
VSAAYQPAQACAPVAVDAVPSASVAAEAPAQVAAWIPEDSSWVGRAAEEVLPPDAAAPTMVARTPVVLATTGNVARAAGRLQALLRPAAFGPVVRAEAPFGTGVVAGGTLRVALPDPQTSAAGALGFAALVRAATGRPLEVAPSYVDPGRRDLTAIRVEHRVHSVTAGDRDPLADLDPESARGASAAVSTEYAVLAAAIGGADLSAAYLGVDLHQPLLTLDPAAGAEVAAFADFLTGADGVDALVAAGLRAAEGDTSPASVGELVPSAYTATSKPAGAQQVAGLATLFDVMHQRISSLVLLDASGSMLEPLPGSSLSKIDLVRRAARNALLVASPRAQTGLVTFQSDAADRPVIRTRVPMALNGSERGDRTHAERMLDIVDRVRVSGGTPLYNAVRAAYRTAVRGYRDGMVNQVVLLSDGRNQDAVGSISLARLVDDLRRLHDAGRPVRIIAIGYGPDADLLALDRIVAVTGGRASWLRTESGYAEAVEAALFAL